MMSTQDMETFESMMMGASIASGIMLLIMLGMWILQAVLAGSLGRKKGYSFGKNFVMGLLLPGLWLLYAAGRPLSPAMEAERQRDLADRVIEKLRAAVEQKGE